MPNLTRASRELFRRRPDETFPSLASLTTHCRQERDDSADIWEATQGLWTKPVGTDHLMLAHGEDKMLQLTDWSFGQLCRLAGVAKDTVNRLAPDTATRVFAETLPRGNKPLQIYRIGEHARSILQATPAVRRSLRL